MYQHLMLYFSGYQGANSLILISISENTSDDELTLPLSTLGHTRQGMVGVHLQELGTYCM